MAALLDLTRATQEPSLIIRHNGLPAGWRWQGRMHSLSRLHATWSDIKGSTWYRVESGEGVLFLLQETQRGWMAARWPEHPGRRPGGPVGTRRAPLAN